MVEALPESQDDKQSILTEETKDSSSTGIIRSDAFPSNMKPKVKSKAHSILNSIIASGSFQKSKIEYKSLSEED